MKVVLYKSPGFISQLIRWQTRSVYSHASLWFVSRNLLCESQYGKGVILVDNPAFTCEVDVFRISGDFDYAKILEFIEAQKGKKYDYSSVCRFISRRQESRKSKGKWFCSELVFAALQKGGLKLLERCEPWEVSPGLLSMSPFLVYEKTLNSNNGS